MRAAFLAAIGVLVTVLGVSGLAQAQNWVRIGLCTLRQYVGSYASVAGTAVDSQLVVGRIDVLAGAAVPPPPPYYYPYPAHYPYPYYYGPPIGIGIGIVFGGGGFRHHR